MSVKNRKKRGKETSKKKIINADNFLFEEDNEENNTIKLSFLKTPISIKVLSLEIKPYLERERNIGGQLSTSIRVISLEIEPYLERERIRSIVGQLSTSIRVISLEIEPYLEGERISNFVNQNKLNKIVKSFLSRTPHNLSNDETKYLVNKEYNLNDIVEGVLSVEKLNKWVIDDSKTFKSKVKNAPNEINFLLKKSIIENLQNVLEEKRKQQLEKIILYSLNKLKKFYYDKLQFDHLKNTMKHFLAIYNSIISNSFDEHLCKKMKNIKDNEEVDNMWIAQDFIDFGKNLEIYNKYKSFLKSGFDLDTLNFDFKDIEDKIMNYHSLTIDIFRMIHVILEVKDESYKNDIDNLNISNMFDSFYNNCIKQQIKLTTSKILPSKPSDRFRDRFRLEYTDTEGDEEYTDTEGDDEYTDTEGEE